MILNYEKELLPWNQAVNEYFDHSISAKATIKNINKAVTDISQIEAIN